MNVSETRDGAIKVGDWVAFLNSGRIVYARVDYIRRDHVLTSGFEVITTEGAVNADRILEIRRADPVTPAEREVLHTLLADFNAVVDRAAQPDLAARYDAVMCPKP